MILFLTICAASAAARAAVGTPAAPLTVELFMDWQNDPEEPWGLMSGNPTSLLMNEDLKLPPCNYSAGATVFASFALDGSSFGSITSSSGTGKVANVSDTDTTSYEVFVAIGRPGEPILGTRSGSAPEPGGVS
eukprot:gene25754-25099_t